MGLHFPESYPGPCGASGQVSRGGGSTDAASGNSCSHTPPVERMVSFSIGLRFLNEMLFYFNYIEVDQTLQNKPQIGVQPYPK